MKIQACLSSKSDYWQTPTKLYHWFIDKGWYDPCPVNPTFNGLENEWKEKNFVNPPYSEIEKWVDKAIEQAKKGKESTLLIPARTDTKWFMKLYYAGATFKFIQGRLKFDDGKNVAPFPSMLVNIYKYSTPMEPKIDLIERNNRYWEI